MSAIKDQKSFNSNDHTNSHDLKSKLNDLATELATGFVDSLDATLHKQAATLTDSVKKIDSKGPGVGMSVSTIFQSLAFHDITMSGPDMMRYTSLALCTFLVLLLLCPTHLLFILLMLILIVLCLVRITVAVFGKNDRANKSINPNKLNKLRKKLNIAKRQPI